MQDRLKTTDPSAEHSISLTTVFLAPGRRLPPRRPELRPLLRVPRDRPLYPHALLELFRPCHGVVRAARAVAVVHERPCTHDDS